MKGAVLKEFIKEIKKVSLAIEWYNQALWKTKQMNVTAKAILVAMVMISVTKRMGIFTLRHGLKRPPKFRL